MPDQNSGALNNKIEKEIQPSLEYLLQDVTGVREIEFLKRIQSGFLQARTEDQLLALFLELSTLMFYDFFFTDAQLEQIDIILKNCEQIALTFSANTSVSN
ncbi:MAG: hypothetical protein ACJZ2G_07520 [Thalassobaculaceae bacterium]